MPPKCLGRGQQYSQPTRNRVAAPYEYSRPMVDPHISQFQKPPKFIADPKPGGRGPKIAACRTRAPLGETFLPAARGEPVVPATPKCGAPTLVGAEHLGVAGATGLGGGVWGGGGPTTIFLNAQATAASWPRFPAVTFSAAAGTKGCSFFCIFKNFLHLHV